MDRYSAPSRRDSSPRISAAESRSLSVDSASGSSISSAEGSTSTSTSTSTSASDRSDSPEPMGRFNTGMIDGTANVLRPPAPADEHGQPAADSGEANAKVANQVGLPLCPTPVRCILLATSLLAGGGGLAMTIYGGIRINGEPVPELDPDRPQSIGLMVGGMLLVAIALVAFLTTHTIRPVSPAAAGAQSG